MRWGKGSFAGALALMTLLLLLPAAARATPPTLDTVADSPTAAGVLTATWTLLRPSRR